MRIPKATCGEWTAIGLSGFLLFSAIVTWILYPIIYDYKVEQTLILSQAKDTSLSYTTYFWSHPPSTNIIKFYLFNVTNPDEVTFYGAKPAIVEVGPFAVIESEEKKYLKFNDDGTEVFYENYKKYILSQELSCADCDWNRTLTFPNSVGLGAASSVLNPQFGITEVGVQIISLFLVLMGEYSFVSHPIREYIFDGYDDPFISAAHSDFVFILGEVFNNGKSIIPIPVPSMKRFGFFQGYNNSRDENYWIKTGKNDNAQLGVISTWGGLTDLPEEWWSDGKSRQILGTDSGSFSPMWTDESTKTGFFFSFMCRSFEKSFLKKSSVDGVPTLDFSVTADQYDTTADENMGFRYRNPEKRNYFPEWPKCPPKAPCTQTGVDCQLRENFCHSCCNGSFYNDTYLLPPGMFPLVCYPGRIQPTPFNVFYSPPHYLWAPEEVLETVYSDMKPDFDLHNPWVFSHEPTSGSLVHMINRLQVNMPVVNNKDVIITTNMRNVVIPLMWQETMVTMNSNIVNNLWMGMVLVPRVINTVKFSLIAISFLIIVILTYLRIRKSRSNRVAMSKI